jgi:hypothetical protein
MTQSQHVWGKHEEKRVKPTEDNRALSTAQRMTKMRGGDKTGTKSQNPWENRTKQLEAEAEARRAANPAPVAAPKAASGTVLTPELVAARDRYLAEKGQAKQAKAHAARAESVLNMKDAIAAVFKAWVESRIAAGQFVATTWNLAQLSNCLDQLCLGEGWQLSYENLDKMNAHLRANGFYESGRAHQYHEAAPKEWPVYTPTTPRLAQKVVERKTATIADLTAANPAEVAALKKKSFAELQAEARSGYKRDRSREITNV